MLSFFRSIRRSLINEGKTSKYIRYAVGEFILIVAGILVALQIQTWNEGRKLELDRRELIENLKSDFQINLERLEEGLVRADNHLDQIAAFMLKATREDVDISSREIGEFYEIVKAPLTFEPLLENYRTSVSDGRFNLLGDQQLQELFASFSEANSEFQRLADTAHDDYVIHGMATVRKRIGSFSALGDPRMPNNPLFAIDNNEFQDLMKDKEIYAAYETRYSLKSARRIKLERLKPTTEQIIAALEALD